jgi:4'-phosphopantetheinyl transferase
MVQSVIELPIPLVWIWKSYDQLDDACFERFQQRFSDSEKQRISNISSKKRWREYIAGHYLLRKMLDTLFSDELEGDAIEHLRDQAPRFRDRSVNLDFNISHSRGLIICLVSQQGDVGIDIEMPKKTANINAIAKAYFSGQEASLIHSLSAEKKTVEFYRLWTLKESLMKATGEGITKVGMQVEFTQWGQQAPHSNWYSYSFVYAAHYGAISLPYFLGDSVNITVYESDMVLDGIINMPLVEYTSSL